MKKKAEGVSLRETFAIHRRAARDMRRIAPGCFMPFILCAVVEAASPYAVIWLSARLVDELSTLRRPEILAKWVLWIVAVSAAAELLKAVLERWKNVRSELLDRQKEVLYTEKFLRMDYADCATQFHQHLLLAQQARDYLAAHYSEAITLPSLAAALGISVSQLKRVFHEQIGQSMVRYLTALRIGEAKRLIREGNLTFTQIAERIGIESIYYFSNLFKKQTGMSPTEYEKTLKE